MSMNSAPGQRASSNYEGENHPSAVEKRERYALVAQIDSELKTVESESLRVILKKFRDKLTSPEDSMKRRADAYSGLGLGLGR